MTQNQAEFAAFVLVVLGTFISVTVAMKVNAYSWKKLGKDLMKVARRAWGSNPDAARVLAFKRKHSDAFANRPRWAASQPRRKNSPRALSGS